MAIPNTPGGWGLTDVRDELGLPSDTELTKCFSSANPGSFDPTYEGSKDRLSNFRNYGATDPLAVSPNPFNLGNGNSSQVVTVTTTVNWSASVTSGASWISLSGASGSGNGSFTANYTGLLNEGRTGTIRVETIGGTIIDITVNEID